MLERCLKQRKRADDVGLNELRRPINRAVDMALGGQMHDHVRPKAAHDLAHLARVDDVASHEAEARIPCHGREIVEVAGIGQLVEDDHLVWRRVDDFPRHGRADEASAAGHENALGHEGHSRAT